jgi:hypothetical protein
MGLTSESDVGQSPTLHTTHFPRKFEPRGYDTRSRERERERERERQCGNVHFAGYFHRVNKCRGGAWVNKELSGVGRESFLRTNLCSTRCGSVGCRSASTWVRLRACVRACVRACASCATGQSMRRGCSSLTARRKNRRTTRDSLASGLPDVTDDIIPRSRARGLGAYVPPHPARRPSSDPRGPVAPRLPPPGQRHASEAAIRWTWGKDAVDEVEERPSDRETSRVADDAAADGAAALSKHCSFRKCGIRSDALLVLKLVRNPGLRHSSSIGIRHASIYQLCLLTSLKDN